MASRNSDIGKPLVLNLAPTGLVPTRAMSPHVPLTEEEIVRDVLAAAGAGITIAHLHARGADGVPTHRKEVFARIIGGIREQRPDLVICVTCSGRHAPDIEQRAEVLKLDGDLKPDMASLTPSSLNFSRDASVNSPDVVKQLATRMRDAGILPEFEIFDLGMANVIAHLWEHGLVRPPFYANLLLGNLAGAQAGFLEVGALAGRLPPDSTWSLGGLGAAQLPVAAMAVAGAPGVRVGLEDNLWLDHARQIPARNMDLVERVHRLCEITDRRVMTPAEFRNVFGLPNR